MLMMAAVMAVLAAGEQPVTVEYRVESKDGKAVVFQGAATLAPHRTLNVERRDAKNHTSSLQVTAMPEGTQTVQFELALFEDGPDAPSLKWKSTVAAQRGESFSTDLGWADGGGRVLKLKLK